MNKTIIAKHNIAITTDKGIVSINKGDKFTLCGTVFAYKGTLISIDKFVNAFEILKDAEKQPQGQTYEFVRDLTIVNQSGRLAFKAGSRITLVNDIVCVNGVVFDVAKYKGFLRAVEYVPEQPAIPAKPAPAPISEQEPASQAEGQETTFEPEPTVELQAPETSESNGETVLP